MNAAEWLHTTAQSYTRDAEALAREHIDGLGEEWVRIYQAVAVELHRCAEYVTEEDQP